MTTVATRLRKISDLEGFDIVIRQNGHEVDVTRNGVLGRWNFQKASRGSWTIQQFKTKFSQAYPSYTCEVLLEDGTLAGANQTLADVRGTYEED